MPVLFTREDKRGTGGEGLRRTCCCVGECLQSGVGFSALGGSWFSCGRKVPMCKRLSFTLGYSVETWKDLVKAFTVGGANNLPICTWGDVEASIPFVNDSDKPDGLPGDTYSIRSSSGDEAVGYPFVNGDCWDFSGLFVVPASVDYVCGTVEEAPCSEYPDLKGNIALPTIRIPQNILKDYVDNGVSTPYGGIIEEGPYSGYFEYHGKVDIAVLSTHYRYQRSFWQPGCVSEPQPGQCGEKLCGEDPSWPDGFHQVIEGKGSAWRYTSKAQEIEAEVYVRFRGED